MYAYRQTGPGGPPLGLASTEGLGVDFRIEDHLRASKQRDGFACFSVRYYRVPDLSGLSEVNRSGNAFD